MIHLVFFLFSVSIFSCQIILRVGNPKLLVRLLRYPNWGGHRHLLLRWVQQLVLQHSAPEGSEVDRIRRRVQVQLISFFCQGEQVRLGHPENQRKIMLEFGLSKCF